MKHAFQFKSFGNISNEIWNSILSLRSSVFVFEQKCIYIDPDNLDSTATHCYLLKNDELIAYARLFKQETWHIGKVITAIKFRNQGLSNELLKETIAEIMEKDPSPKIELSAQTYLHDFYARLGFTAIGSMYLEDGIPHLKMVYSPLE